MISFRDSRRAVFTDEQLQRLRSFIRCGDAEALFIEAGAAEQGIVDALCPQYDTISPTTKLFRALSLNAARAYLKAHAGLDVRTALCHAEQALDVLAGAETPSEVSITAPEGYTHYALNPADYAVEAEAYVRDVGRERARAAVVIGVRSIGTSLSAIVAAVLGAEHSFTIRPRGASEARHVMADSALLSQLAEWLDSGGDVLVVDEGPGATGETFHCIGRWLFGLGVAPERVVLFPSHTGAMGLAPDERRAWFAACRKYPPVQRGDRAAEVAGALDLSVVRDLSGGAWRSVVPGAQEAAANVNHERLKYLAVDEHGARYMLRYAGLGHWGRAVLNRAETLADLDAGPKIHGAVSGFLAYEWLEGKVAPNIQARSNGIDEAVGAYLVRRSVLFNTRKDMDVAPLVEALIQNAEEALGASPPGLSEAVRRVEDLPPREAVVSDARMHPVEWVQTASGFVKVDAFDHGDGTRLPGPCDAAWDVVGAVIEFGWEEEQVLRAIEQISSASADRKELAAAVRAYEPVYAACCLGEVDIAARETHDENERRRLYREVARYRALLSEALEKSSGNGQVT